VLCTFIRSIELQGQDYTASKSIYEHLIAVQGRHVWVGELIGQVCENLIKSAALYLSYAFVAQRHKLMADMLSMISAQAVVKCLRNASVRAMQLHS
jgi:hypothetical protein